ncbi:MAG: phosphate-starvation-inducible PsiE family protein [Gammaproteobacteria bacterium]|nr:phosphate-starvation-inducible PsiE family protein [Gammaproteobacteria bacterium]
MKKVSKLGHKAITIIEDIGLIIIAVATVIAVGIEIEVMVKARTVTLSDLLLLFIYLEVLAMVAIYLESGKLPVRMPLYIAIVALARYMILDMKGLDNWRIIAIAAAILLISLAVLVHRYGHNKLPYEKGDDSR